MYSITPLDPETAPRFERLAPYDVRPLLHELRTLPRLDVVGAALMGEPIGLGIAARDMPVAVDGRIERSRSARLLSLAVSRAYRRIGVGTGIRRQLETQLASKGAADVSFSYAFAGEQLEAAEAFFEAGEWSAPTMTMLHCRADRAILAAPLLQDALVLPAEYEICDWIDVTPAERQAIRDRQRESPWFPPELDPFHFERGCELLNSLALRYRGEVVGWLLTSRTARTTIHYRCLFVRQDLARLGRGLALIVEAIRRQQAVWDVFAPDTGSGEWGTPASLPAMVRFIRRHLAPYTIVTERRVVRKSLKGGAESTRPGPALVTTNERRPSTFPFLTGEQCATVSAGVHAMRGNWVRRELTPRFHTLGASWQLDYGLERYADAARHTNAFMRARFAALYDALSAALPAILGAPVRFNESYALPGFRILGNERGASLPIAPVRCAYPHPDFNRAPSLDQPVSFIVSVAAESVGTRAALNSWPVTSEATVGLDTDEVDRLLDAVPVETHAFGEGELLVFPSLTYHQNSPLGEQAVTDRITFEGHAFRTSTSWEVYW